MGDTKPASDGPGSLDTTVRAIDHCTRFLQALSSKAYVELNLRAFPTSKEGATDIKEGLIYLGSTLRASNDSDRKMLQDAAALLTLNDYDYGLFILC